MKKIVIKNGLIAGGILVVMMGLSLSLMSGDVANFKLAEIIGYTTMLVALSMIFFGVRSFREQSGGKLTFGKAFMMGLYITLIASALYVVGWMVLSSLMAPDFGEQYYSQFIEQIKSSDKPQEEIDKLVAGYEKNKELYEKPLVKIGITFLEIFPVGLIVSLVSALILRKS